MMAAARARDIPSYFGLGLDFVETEALVPCKTKVFLLSFPTFWRIAFLFFFNRKNKNVDIYAVPGFRNFPPKKKRGKKNIVGCSAWNLSNKSFVLSVSDVFGHHHPNNNRHIPHTHTQTQRERQTHEESIILLWPDVYVNIRGQTRNSLAQLTRKQKKKKIKYHFCVCFSPCGIERSQWSPRENSGEEHQKLICVCVCVCFVWWFNIYTYLNNQVVGYV